jgi:hypothetical protein
VSARKHAARISQLYCRGAPVGRLGARLRRPTLGHETYGTGHVPIAFRSLHVLSSPKCLRLYDHAADVVQINVIKMRARRQGVHCPSQKRVHNGMDVPAERGQRYTTYTTVVNGKKLVAVAPQKAERLKIQDPRSTVPGAGFADAVDREPQTACHATQAMAFKRCAEMVGYDLSEIIDTAQRCVVATAIAGALRRECCGTLVTLFLHDTHTHFTD